MAEKRKLLAEIDKCFKKIDEGVELFEETMVKMQEANSDNQREKYQDDLKKEIKKLQRLRDQVKGWQNCSEIKDKDKLTHYRKLIEQRMEQFKDIERENKTKPHSKQGLSAEEKLDPREKEKVETIEWLQNQIRELSDEADRTESQIESISTADGGKRRGKKEDGKKGEKEKRMEELKRHLERMKFHIGKLEVCMRMVNNESLESKRVMDVLKDPLEMYVDALVDPDYEGDLEHLETLDPEDAYEELDLIALSAQIGGIQVGPLDEEKENGHDNGSTNEGSGIDEGNSRSGGSRHGSQDTPASPAPRRTVAAASVPVTPAKDGSVEAGQLGPLSVNQATPPPPPGIPYNSVAAGRIAASSSATNTSTSATSPASVVNAKTTVIATRPSANSSGGVQLVQLVTSTSTQPNSTSGQDDDAGSTISSQNEGGASSTTDEVVNKSDERMSTAPQPITPKSLTTANGAAVKASAALSADGSTTSAMADVVEGVQRAPGESSSSRRSGDVSLDAADDPLRVLRLSQQNQQPANTEPQRAHIPAWLGASPLGRTPTTNEMEMQLAALEASLARTPLPMDSERPRTYLPKIPCPCASYYPQVSAQNVDTLEYYLRLSPETLFFIFYYMEMIDFKGTRAQLLAAKALKKLSWRFHTKYLTWFQRHEEPKQITDDFEQGTYVYFDYEKWSQRKKESFTFEYRYLEDKDFE
ncbi:Not1 domain, CCR4-Not complex component [Oesophagostomum dentatum]|uniref:Not1 domain, CCR4-Not complex component n=1 Tax=Oesophagostomum dentatum TaxID=61180 RepID=A0A0B1TEI7_OESDE|nr:Not1 domain, CCR4-Not complex component [Oesophagostomum dentatum]